MTRVLYMCPSATVGGAEVSLLDLIRNLPRDRYEPSLIVPEEGPMAEAGRGAGARVTPIRWPSAVMKTGRERSATNRLLALIAPFLLVPTIARTSRFIRKEGVDLVHTNGTKAHLGGGLAARLAGVPVVWHLRDVLAPGLLRSILRFLSRWIPSRMIANSRASARTLSDRGPGGRVALVYNGIDPDVFRPLPGPSAARSGLGIPRDGFVIGTLGALAPLKGHIHLIRAMPAVLERAPEAFLLIVGGEMYGTLGHAGHRAHLERETERLGLTGRVILAGRRDDVVDLYNAMDVVALASVRPESFGRILIEAMACERPVIATDLGGPREIIAGPEIGILVPPADPGALAEAVLSLHRDPEARVRMGRAGRKTVMERFTMERHIAAVCSIYEDMMRKSGSARRPESAGAAG